MTPNTNSSSHEIYVSPDGNDKRWTGNVPEPTPDGKRGPLASIDGARKAVRRLRASGELRGPVTVWLRGGRYFLDDPVIFTPEDSCPVTYASYPGEEAILDGGRRISGWREGQVNGRTAWVAHIPEVAEGTWYFYQLFANGRRRTRALMPKEGLYWIEGVPGVEPKEMYKRSKVDTFHCAPGDIQNWKNLTDVEVVILHFWNEERLPIGSFDEDTRLVKSRRTNVRAFIDDVGDRFPKYYVENIFEALTEPGEWYLDRNDGKLYYIPMPGETPDTCEIIAPRLTQLLRFDGRPDDGEYVEWIRFERLAFEHADWTRLNADGESSGCSQAAADIDGVVRFEGARNCAIEDCRIAHVGWTGLELADGCTACRIVGNEIFDVGACGIKINGSAAKQPLCRRTGNNHFTDNYIHDGGQVSHSGVGILLMHSFANEVSHNHICNFHYTGISLGWEWSFAENVSRDNSVRKNHIHDIGTGWLSDMGGIYTLGVQSGTTLRGNLIHDIRKSNYGGWGIYNDEGSAHMVVEDNIIYNTDSHPYHMHVGREVTVRNNIFAFGKMGQVALSNAGGAGLYGKAFTVERNILISNGQPMQWGGYWGFFRLHGIISDLNLLWDVQGKPFTFEEANDKYHTTKVFDFDEWKAFGHDQHSIAADPKCKDPLNYDFTLADDSPAFAFGFRPIDMSDVGPRAKEDRD
ncbi:MAG: right-handed parallel beta-helix repeat-containing protein [Planctomycetes bacterium]|nr:right-handed parallel beta-helix repeat-containing protein [Planctomycetota bacterium]